MTYKTNFIIYSNFKNIIFNIIFKARSSVTVLIFNILQTVTVLRTFESFYFGFFYKRCQGTTPL